MNSKHLTHLTLSAAIAAALFSGAACAQDATPTSTTQTATTQTSTAKPAANQAQQQQASTKNAQSLQEVVVTGSAAYGGLKKIDTSYSITSLSAQQIKQANPVSTADLLKAAPGVFPESSGGETGANIEVAGFPGGGDAPFVTLQMNGSPLYPQANMSFFEQTSMFRLDDTIDRTELVLGGPGVLYGNGQSGLTANFILKQGTDTPTGDLGYTYGSEGSSRVDGFIGFPLGKDTGWYGSFGGFWRKSDGVRDPQFPADNGGQLTATLTRDWDNGSLMFYARALRDHNQFVTDTPIYNPSAGNFSDYPGYNPLTGTFGSSADQYEFIQTTPCHTSGCTPGGIPVNLAKGRGAAMRVFGANFDWDFGNGWTLSDDASFTGGQMNTVSFFSTGANPSSLGSYIDSQVASDIASGQLPAGAYTSTAAYTNGQAAGLNQNVTTQGLWYVHKRLGAVSNEFHISKELFDGNTLTLGNYSAVYDMHETWYLGNNMLLQAKSNPNPVVVNLSNGTNTYQLSSPQGFVSGPTTAFQQRWNAFNTAFFLTDSWKVDNWLFDAGIRDERQDASGAQMNSTTGDLDGNPYTLYNNGAAYLTSGLNYMKYDKTAPSWTVGANYEFNANMSAYVRINDGVHFPDFNDIQGSYPNITPVEKIHNMEIGFKYQADWVYLDVNAYRKLFYGVPYTYTDPQGQELTLVYGSSTKGVDLSSTFKPFDHFTVALSGDYMDGHYTNTGLEAYTTQAGTTAYASMWGMQLQRQPKLQYRLTPAYDIPMPWGDLNLWVTYEYVGSRYGDLIEQQPLGNYHDLSFGAVATVNKNWQVSLQGTNITNQLGITEGNSRLFGFASTGGVILARSIEGREVNFQVKYQF